ncbi:hypothetical protein Sjap_000253 [Stephania japonica]|uniref:non-specific serine/threonine protein kinase n=1 Tax=Stephania japonica TaxID=461633 RepID=A0AAP0KHM6_9MAGN
MKLFFYLLLLFPHQISSIDFLYNGFSPSDLLLFGTAALQSQYLTLTNASPFSIGRALHPHKLPTKNQTLFTSFIFSISPVKGFNPGHGFTFLLTPSLGINGTSSSQHLGLFNRTNDGSPTNHVFAVEFDVFKNPEFNDPDDNHVGINVNSLTSRASHAAGFWQEKEHGDSHDFVALRLNDGGNYQVWVDYVDFVVSVRMAPAGAPRPNRGLIELGFDLSSVLLDEMYVGFGASTGQLVETHRILGWSFSNSNPRFSESLVSWNLPSFLVKDTSVFQSKWFVVGIVLGGFVFFLCSCGVVVRVCMFCFINRNRRTQNGIREDLEEWELEYWPHRIGFREIEEATDGFGSENVIGFGGHGKVYRGVLGGGVHEVAVKVISNESEVGMREFAAEVSSIGRLKHRNLVGMRGWCKKDKGSFMLVYDYMENGSLDKRVFECEESMMLSWGDRIRILKDVAHGVLYLHEGWEARVLHRDIKASNVLLDKEMNGRLGDFGLARIYGHGQTVNTSRVVGTVGYMAPEVLRSGRASSQSDVFGFGVLILEVVCGRRPIEDGKAPLIDWIWELVEKGELVNALDERLRAKGGGVDFLEVEKVLQLGLLCAYHDPRSRPTMRQVVQVLEGTFGLYESEEEGMEVTLLDKLKSTAMWSKHRYGLRAGGHPTFNQIRQSLSSSMSLSSSDVILEGR